MRPTVLLFDIDGTLVTTGGAGRRSLERAFEARYGRPDACRGFRFDGMTDRAIVRGGLSAIGVPVTPEEVDAVLAAYLIELEDEVRKADPAKYRVHLGMEHAIEHALKSTEVAVGLGTGNIKEGARIKLERVGIHHHFGFGGFGSDHEDRIELIRTGAERGAKKLGMPLSECRVVVIGDTPKDVAAAQGIGAESIGVGTGSFTAKQLLEVGATFAFDNLANEGALKALLGR